MRSCQRLLFVGESVKGHRADEGDAILSRFFRRKRHASRKSNEEAEFGTYRRMRRSRCRCV
uniref:Uncharacterized protein n=1 Tax=Hyaloperonospora arabidopsidis (strain Emoy2) TaxID=559515 RepID=M4BSM0_HYAAE